MSNHPFVHVEISCLDSEAAKKFYGELFGWKFQDFPQMNYTTIDTGQSPDMGGGLNPVTPENPAGTVIVYVYTEDIDDSLGKVEALGGTVILPKMEVPTVGFLAFFKDPTGNTLALLQPEMQQG
jgi:predicted enzyme related to lactoylglutathione lyase